jgi:hypothetical protein
MEDDSPAADIVVGRDAVPDVLFDSPTRPTWRRVLHQVHDRGFLLDVPGVARYLVTDGRTITVQVVGDLDSAALFLMGSPLAALLHQRGTLVLRASVIGTPQGAVVLMGESGVGKSVLAARLTQRGYPLVSDEMAVFSADPTPTIHAGAPEIALWQHGCRLLEIAPESGRRLRPGLKKYAFSPVSSHALPMPVYRVYALRLNNEETVTITPIEGIARTMALNNGLYGLHIAADAGQVARYWLQIAQVATVTPMATITRPLGGCPVDDLIALMTAEWR